MLHRQEFQLPTLLQCRRYNRLPCPQFNQQHTLPLLPLPNPYPFRVSSQPRIQLNNQLPIHRITHLLYLLRRLQDNPQPFLHSSQAVAQHLNRLLNQQGNRRQFPPDTRQEFQHNNQLPNHPRNHLLNQQGNRRRFPPDTCQEFQHNNQLPNLHRNPLLNLLRSRPRSQHVNLPTVQLRNRRRTLLSNR
jgi:hypothetical protein